MAVLCGWWISRDRSPEEERGFSGERALETVESLCARGNRHYGAEKRADVIAHLHAELDRWTDQSALQRFDAEEKTSGQTYELVNLIGRQGPEKERRILLGTHWDTRLWAEEDPDPSLRDSPIDGANDGTSGVAVLLEIARVIRDRDDIQYGVDFVLFDGEEFGRPGSDDYCQGSRYFARMLRSLYPQSRPELAVVIDMVGDCQQGYVPETSSLTKAPQVNERIWNAAERLGYGEFFRRSRPVGIEDDHTALQKVGIPAVLLIDYDYPYWHTQGDTVDKVCARSLERTGKVLIEVLREEVPTG